MIFGRHTLIFYRLAVWANLKPPFLVFYLKSIKTVDVHEAQQKLAELIDQVAAGTEIILTDGITPRACLVPIGSLATTGRVPGLHAGSMITSTDFDMPLIEAQPDPADLTFLENQINTYNMAKVGAYDGQMLAIFVRDAAGAITAGLSGYTWARMCEINFLWVQAELRGQGYGSQLLHMAEAEARARGCLIVILRSYSFQAPAFYQQFGYELAGQITGCPPGHTNCYLYKRLL